jgi:hypothetical protein
MLEVLWNHTVGRVKAAWQVATFPAVTPKWFDLRVWRACARLALRGLVHRDAYALLPFVNERARVEGMEKRLKGSSAVMPPRTVASHSLGASLAASGWRICRNQHCGWMGTRDGACPRCNGATELQQL